ncbi:MAG: hypothetical protein J6V07_07225 [Clostridia bacterium]|nr:hypothetical protein [Clostridia bacterium]
MKKRRLALATRRFFRRFNPWLFLLCVLLALVIWCATMYVEDPNGLRKAALLLSGTTLV